MARATWFDTVKRLRQLTGLCSDVQKVVARELGVPLDETTPRIVALYKLVSALFKEAEIPAWLIQSMRLRRAFLCRDRNHPPTEEQLEYISVLSSGRAPEMVPSSDEATAWIQYLSVQNRIDRIESDKLEEGDIVAVRAAKPISKAIVSSFASDGRVFFKGEGFAWPDQVKLLFRSNDASVEAKGALKEIENRNSDRATASMWSIAKHEELKRFEVQRAATTRDIDELEIVINGASDEKPIQSFLESKPELLGSLLSGKNRYIIPQASLGGKYLADFFLADTDSLGITWWLVELETPHSSILLKSNDNHDLWDEYVRKGLAQIIHWREEIEADRGRARRSRREGGWGYFDIRPRSRGILIVGRRHLANRRPDAEDVARNRLRDEEDIHVHTYDWLLERLRSPSRVMQDDPFLLADEEKRLHELRAARARELE